MLFVLGFLPVPFGTLATITFFFVGLFAILDAARRRSLLRMPRFGGFAVLAALAYFAVDFLAFVTHGSNAGASIAPVAAIQFLFFPLALIGLAAGELKDPLRTLLAGIRFGTIIAGAIGVVQILDGDPRAVGGMINANRYGAAITLFAFLSLLHLDGEGLRARLWGIAAFAMGLAASILSESRSAWLLIPLFGIVVLVHVGVRHGRRAVLAISALAAIVVVAVALTTSSTLRERTAATFEMLNEFVFGETRDEDDPAYSLDQRLMLLVYGGEAYLDAPVFGYGPQNAVAEVQARAAADGRTIGAFSHLHNQYLTDAVGKGIFGIATLLMLIAAPLVVAFRSPRDRHFADRMAIATMLTGGSAIAGLMIQIFGNDIANTIYATLLAALVLSARASADAAERRPP